MWTATWIVRSGAPAPAVGEVKSGVAWADGSDRPACAILLLHHEPVGPKAYLAPLVATPASCTPPTSPHNRYTTLLRAFAEEPSCLTRLRTSFHFAPPPTCFFAPSGHGRLNQVVVILLTAPSTAASPFPTPIILSKAPDIPLSSAWSPRSAEPSNGSYSSVKLSSIAKRTPKLCTRTSWPKPCANVRSNRK